MKKWSFAVLACALLTGASDGASAKTRDAREPPSDGSGPIVVTIRFQVLDFARVNSRDESFDLTGYLEMNWTDPRLALKQKSSGPGIRTLKAGDIWIPRVYFPNALDQPRDHGEPEVEVDSKGHVSHGEIISGKFSAELSLRSFPFDRQWLPVRIGAFLDQTKVVLRSSPDRVTLSHQAFLTDWSILGITVNQAAERYTPESEPYSVLVIETAVARKWNFYVWRVLVPMTLLVMLSWTVLWMDPVIVAPQATTAVGTLISLVAFNFTIDFAMPKLGYLTFIDRHALLGLAFVAAIVIEVAAAHHSMIRERSEYGHRIQMTSRWVIPACYFVAVGIEVCWLLFADQA